ncbi:MAG TPA: hypothetical protein VGT61_10105 [Thermomicrobiales bacterium]|jgi:hypothetical protein|nr:hypothetical protein [Thermomicrobiales bacterium]
MDESLVGIVVGSASMLVALAALAVSVVAIQRSGRSVLDVQRFVAEARAQQRTERDLWSQPRSAKVTLIGERLGVATSIVEDAGLLTFVLRNDGDAPASQVRVGVTYPTGAEVRPTAKGDLPPGAELTCEFPIDHARFGDGDSRVFMLDVSYRDRTGLIDRLMPVHLVMKWGAAELQYFLGPVDQTVQTEDAMGVV